MRITALALRDFRSYAEAGVRLGPGLTVVHGPNGAGKTNLVEALYFGCTGRSCRTANEREVLRFGERVTRVEVRAVDADGPHTFAVALSATEGKRISVDGAPVERLLDLTARPLACVFLPDRLELVKGAPAGRRAHLDQVVAALWPARAGARRDYARALTQRNALLGRIRAGHSSRESLGAWDAELARHGIVLMEHRRSAAEALAGAFAARAGELGLDGEAELAYRPRSRATTTDELAAELRERLDGDLERGFTGHGPHRDDLALTRDGRDLRVYGSQGQQRLALLALLLAERAALTLVRGAPPIMLLDDVLSELDPARRDRLIDLLREGGQSVITTADASLLPGVEESGAVRIRVAEGGVLSEESAAAEEPVSGEGPVAGDAAVACEKAAPEGVAAA